MASAILAEHKAQCLASCLGTDLESILGAGLAPSSFKGTKGALNRSHDDILNQLTTTPPPTHRTSFAQFLGVAGSKAKHKHFLSAFTEDEDYDESRQGEMDDVMARREFNDSVAHRGLTYDESCHKTIKVAVCREEEGVSPEVLNKLNDAKCDGKLKSANVVFETHAFKDNAINDTADLSPDDEEKKPDLIVSFGGENCKEPEEGGGEHFLKFEDGKDGVHLKEAKDVDHTVKKITDQIAEKVEALDKDEHSGDKSEDHVPPKVGDDEDTQQGEELHKEDKTTDDHEKKSETHHGPPH